MYTRVKKNIIQILLFLSIFILFFSSCTQKYRIDYAKLDEFQNNNYDSVDTVDMDFKNMVISSQEYIEKFDITEDENFIIGFWKDATGWLIPNNHKTNKIGIYSFLPNKKYIKSSHYDGSPLVIKYGNWRVVNKQLEIQNSIVCTVINKRIVNYEYIDNPRYETIFTMEQYDKYPINITPFINEKVPRYRAFHDFINYGSKIYSPSTPSGSILYNPEDKPEYIEKLLNLAHFYFY